MASLTSQLTVRLKDSVSGPAGKAARSIRDLDRTAKNARGGARHLAASTRSLAAAGTALDGAGLGMSVAGGAVGVAAFAVGAGLAKAGKQALSFERSMYEVEKATNTSGAGAQKYAKDILRISRETGKTKEEIAQLMAQAGFAGRPVEELTRFTEYAAKATSAWGTSAEETGQAMAVIGNIYAANQTRIEEIGDAINTAADVSATRETDLLEFIKRVGASGKQAGFSAEQVLAFGAAMGESGTRMEVAATGFESLLNVMKLGKEFSKGAGAGLKALGIDSTKMRKQFAAKPLETTLDLLNRINKVADPLKRAEILTDIFGKEYQDDIQKLMNSLPRVNSLLQTMGDRRNYIGSVQQGFDLFKEKDYAKIEKAERAWDSLMTKLGQPIKIRMGSAATELQAFLENLESGETLLQRMLTRFESYQKEKARLEGKLGPDGVIQMDGPAVDASSPDNGFDKWIEANAPWFSPKLMRQRLEEWAGGTSDDAVRSGRSAAIAEDVARENAILDRESKAKVAAEEARRRMNERPLTPSEQRRFQYEVDRADDEHRAAQREADVVRRKRAELPGSVAQLERQVRSVNGAMSFGRDPSDGPFGPGGSGGGMFAPTRSGFVTSNSLDVVQGQAEKAGQAIQALDTTVAPNVDVSGIETAQQKADRLLATLTQIGAMARATGSVPLTIGRGSGDVGQAFESRRGGSFADWEHG